MDAQCLPGSNPVQVWSVIYGPANVSVCIHVSVQTLGRGLLCSPPRSLGLILTSASNICRAYDVTYVKWPMPAFVLVLVHYMLFNMWSYPGVSIGSVPAWGCGEFFFFFQRKNIYTTKSNACSLFAFLVRCTWIIWNRHVKLCKISINITGQQDIEKCLSPVKSNK